MYAFLGQSVLYEVGACGEAVGVDVTDVAGAAVKYARDKYATGVTRTVLLS